MTLNLKKLFGRDFKDEEYTKDGKYKPKPKTQKPKEAEQPPAEESAKKPPKPTMPEAPPISSEVAYVGDKKTPGAPDPAPEAPPEPEKPKTAKQLAEEAYIASLDDVDKETARVLSVFIFAMGMLLAFAVMIRGTDGWRAFHEGMLGSFGVTALAVPAAFINTSILISKYKPDIPKYVGMMVFAILILCGAVQIFFVGEIPGDRMKDHFRFLYEDGIDLKGGGVVSIVIGGSLLGLLGHFGAGIVIMILTFVLLLIITGKDLMEFFEWVGKPIYFIVQCFTGVYNVIMGGSFDEAFDDDDDEEYYDDYYDEDSSGYEMPDPAFSKDMEAIAIVNSRDCELDVPIYISAPTEDGATEEEEFSRLFDVPIYEENAPLRDEPPRADDSFIDIPIDGEQNAADEPVTDLDAMIRRAAETKSGAGDFDDDYLVENPKEEQLPMYILPGLELLTAPKKNANRAELEAETREKADIIVNTLRSFGVEVKIQGIFIGPSITRYEIKPGAGVKVSKIRGLEDDIALSLAAHGVRMEAPVPGKSAIGIEVPNINKEIVTLREMLASPEFDRAESKLAFAVGKDITGKVLIGDITKMPHVIIAGTTGSGKSVCTRSIIMSILYKATPDEVKMILIDPKVVEFKVFEGIPHLLIPIVTDIKKAAGALNWAVNEMMRRYNAFADIGANDLRSYNEIAEEEEMDKMAQVVIFIDELADMMMVAGKEVEDSICRLAQMGRAAGIHLVVATQRPTTDVITGLIKANIPSRIALSVMSQVDSRTIIDMAGADKLLGNGDMLYMPIGTSKPIRLQGCFASSKDISETLNFIRAQATGEYDSRIVEAVDNFIPQTKGDKGGDTAIESGSEEDYIVRGAEVAVTNGQVSTTMLQRKLKLGYAKAARIMDELEERGIIGPSEGSKPRKVLMSKMQFDDWKMRHLEEN